MSSTTGEKRVRDLLDGQSRARGEDFVRPLSSLSRGKWTPSNM